ELLRVAAFWKPNLNDGVQITAAPLWRLFRHRPWQKRLRDTWEKLEAGEYDWAHLAYSIWPERVREKCKTDKSLAIAHDLEHLYVEPPQKTKKRRRRKKSQEEGLL
ncbi:type II restriction endonuclease subunit M, partial [Candidatus Parcubacteria bacterium]